MKDWKYLETEVFFTRQMIAASVVRDCKVVIEVGSYKTPTYPFFRTKHGLIVCIDPIGKDKNGEVSVGKLKITEDLRVFAETLEEAFEELEGLKNFGLIALGFELHATQFGYFSDLVSRSKVTVLECWEDHSPYKGIRAYLAAHCDKKVAFRLGMDMSGNKFGDLTDSWPPRTNRELVVLR